MGRLLTLSAVAAAALLASTGARAGEASAEAAPTVAAAEEPESAAALAAPSPPPRFLVDRLAAGVSFGYFSNDDLRFLTRIHFDFPFIVARQKGVFVRGRLSSSISEIGKDFTPEVEDLDYMFEFGSRDYISPRIAVAAYIGQQGSENLDEAGSAWVRYIGFGAQSATFPRPGGENRFDWNFDAGGVIESKGIEGDWVVRGDVLWDAVRLESSSIGLDVSFDSLVTSGDWRTDWTAGPRWSFDLENGIRTSLFARYLHGSNPLGVGVSGLHAGFSYTEGAYRGPRRGGVPDVKGVLSLGAGDNRAPAGCEIQAHLPQFRIAGREIAGHIEVDANTLVGRGADNFFYFLTATLETPLADGIVAGLSASHRSYHELAGASASPVDMNLVELSARSPGWRYADRSPRRLVAEPPERWPGALQWTLGAGYFVSSSTRQDPRWLARAGARWDLPGPRERLVPYLMAAADIGEVSRTRAGLGVAFPLDMTLGFEYRRDNQLRGRDKSEVALLFSLYF